MLLAFKVVWSGDGWLELVFLDTALDSSAPERLNYTRPPLDHGVPLKSPIITLFQIIPWSPNAEQLEKFMRQLNSPWATAHLLHCLR